MQTTCSRVSGSMRSRIFTKTGTFMGRGGKHCSYCKCVCANRKRSLKRFFTRLTIKGNGVRGSSDGAAIAGKGSYCSLSNAACNICSSGNYAGSITALAAGTGNGASAIRLETSACCIGRAGTPGKFRLSGGICAVAIGIGRAAALGIDSVPGIASALIRLFGVSVRASGTAPRNGTSLRNTRFI